MLSCSSICLILTWGEDDSLIASAQKDTPIDVPDCMMGSIIVLVLDRDLWRWEDEWFNKDAEVENVGVNATAVDDDIAMRSTRGRGNDLTARVAQKCKVYSSSSCICPTVTIVCHGSIPVPSNFHEKKKCEGCCQWNTFSSFDGLDCYDGDCDDHGPRTATADSNNVHREDF